MKTISILGCGWLGLPLGESLAQQGYQVKGSTTSSSKIATIQQAGIEPFLIKIDKKPEGNHVADFFDADILILNIPPGRRDPDVLTNYPNRIQLVLEAVQQSRIAKLIFVSSTGVYANTNGIVTEESSLQAERKSGQALIQCEALVQASSTLQTTILRMAGLVGGSRKIGNFLAGKKDLKNGEAPVNLVHLDDCLAIISQIIQQEKWNKIYNVCADQHPKKNVLYPTKAKEAGKEAPTFQKNDVPSFKIVSNHHLKTDLNYTFLKPDPGKF